MASCSSGTEHFPLQCFTSKFRGSSLPILQSTLVSLIQSLHHFKAKINGKVPVFTLIRFRYSADPWNWPPANLFEEDESVIGDCVVFEEGVFENPFVAANEQNSAEEDDDRDGLIPEDWKDLQREFNMTKKEKKKIMQIMELSNSFLKEFELFRDSL